MKLKDIIDFVSWEDVAKVLQAHYKKDWEKSHYGFENVFYRLKELEPQEAKGMIVVKEQVDLINEGNTFVAVSFFIDDTFYAPDFTPWNVWLGMDIASKSFEFKFEEIAAHCLWEMTYYGFSETKIESTYKKLADAFEKVKKEIKKDLDR